MRKMAHITCWPLDLSTPLDGVISEAIAMSWVRQAEKKTFPRHEALDFDHELRKNNTDLVIILREGLIPSAQALVGYSVFSRNKRTVLLHKVCILKEYRRQGFAKRLLEMQQEKYRRQGCEKIQLWVDEKRMSAKGLYTGLGFIRTNQVENYYALGRTGIQMVLLLLPSENKLD